MEPVSEQERSMGRLYRRILLAAGVMVIAITIWMLLPARPLDLRFLKPLKPQVRHEDYGTYIEVDADPPEVEKVLDARLTAQSGWRKSGSMAGYSQYENRNRAMPVLIVTTRYAASAPPPAVSSTVRMASPKTLNGTTIEVRDPRGTAILP
jgi:hypothetical protein